MKHNPSGFDFNDLFIFEVANNHQGDVHHALRIVRELAQVVQDHGIRAAVKFQFRQLESLIHPKHQHQSGHHQVKRFLSTKLDSSEFQRAFDEVRKHSLITACTPFDEPSVELVVKMGFDLIKVGSPSASDWPLLERVGEANLPVAASTGGLNIDGIDNLASFFDHRGVDYALMHCVSVYPTPDPLAQLNQIDVLRRRYPGRAIGWSTHGEPDELSAIQIAVGKGAVLFERHVGIPTDRHPLNRYSSTPEQISQWLKAYQRARLLCGPTGPRAPSPEEIQAMDSLRRGVFAQEPIEKGIPIGRSQVYFAIPFVEGQLTSGEWKEAMIAQERIEAHAPVLKAQLRHSGNPHRVILQKAVHKVKALLSEANIVLNSTFKVEYSHHYGIENFEKVGAILIECVNRDYCKKIIVQLPGQGHPLHFHKLKDETFQVLYGVLQAEVEGQHFLLSPGGTVVVQPGVWHRFWTETGAVFEEISSRASSNDSFYKDKVINKKSGRERKTVVDHWGRFQLLSERKESG